MASASSLVWLLSTLCSAANLKERRQYSQRVPSFFSSFTLWWLCDYVFPTYRKDGKLKKVTARVFLTPFGTWTPLFPPAGSGLAVRLFCNFPSRILIVALGLESYKGSLNSFLENNVIRLNRKSCQRENEAFKSVGQTGSHIYWVRRRTEMNVYE